MGTSRSAPRLVTVPRTATIATKALSSADLALVSARRSTLTTVGATAQVRAHCCSMGHSMFFSSFKNAGVKCVFINVLRVVCARILLPYYTLETCSIKKDVTLP